MPAQVCASQREYNNPFAESRASHAWTLPGEESGYDTCMDWFARLFKDFRYASRSLRKSPEMAAAMIVTLALGIGANTAIFSVLEGVVLALVEMYHQPDRLVLVLLFNRSLGSRHIFLIPIFWTGSGIPVPSNELPQLGTPDSI